MNKGYLKFNNKSSKEFDIEIEDIKVSIPKPKLIFEKIPYSNEYYDFSNAAGPTQYEQREIKVIFNFLDANRVRINSVYSKLISWLHSSNKSILDIDFIRGHFNARISDISEIKYENYNNFVEVTFIADPFIIGNKYGADIWNEFNFITDNSEVKSYTINGTTTIELINSGVDVVPVISSSSNIKINIDGKSFDLVNGRNRIPILYIKSGLNKIELTGSGVVEFDFNVQYI